MTMLTIILWLLAALGGQTPPVPSDAETLRQLLLFALSSGYGGVHYWLMEWIKSEWADWRGPISKRTQRYLSAGLCLAVPTLLYLALLQLPGDARYEWPTHVMYIVTAFGFAFGISQLIHGKKELPSGADAGGGAA